MKTTGAYLTGILWGILFIGNAYTAVYSTNFDDPALTAGIYANGTSINSGNLNLAVKSTTNYTVEIATSSITSTKAIRLTDNNSTTQVVGGVSTDIASLVNGSGGYVTGSSSFAPLAISSGTRSIFVLAMASSLGTGGTTSVFQISIAQNLTLSYYAGTTYTTAQNSGTNVVLSTGTQYTCQWWIDLSSTTQDTYGFSIYNSSNSLIFSSGTIGTRAANITTTNVYYQAFAGFETGGTYASSDPLMEVYNMSVTTVPEPKTWVLGIVGLFVIAVFTQKRILRV